MRTNDYLNLIKYDLNGPVLSRAFAAVTSAAVAAVLLLGVLPASAGAASSNRPAEDTLRLASATTTATPKVVGTASAAKPLPDRAVYRKVVRVAKPKPAATSSARPKSSSRSGSTGGWNTALVSWYGPGFYGHTMAGGGTLQRDSMVVAHRSLPFGTRIMFSYNGKSVTAVVRDRGPYAGGRTFDLGPGTAKALGFSGVGKVRYRILGR